MKIISRNNPPTCGIVCLVLGCFFLLKALMVAFFRTPIHDFVDFMIRQQVALASDSMMTELWTNPPVTPLLKVYLYNVTNSEAFLAGLERPSVVEVGPYAYNAPQTKRILGYEDDDNIITFQSRTTYTFNKEASGFGLDADMDFVIVPNLLVMTGMLKTEVKPQPDFVKTGIVWPILTSAGKKTPFVKLTVNEFLWGYEDELACLETNPDQNQNEEDSFFESDAGFDDFFSLDAKPETTTEKPHFRSKKKDFRRKSDGKCIFGALVEKNATWEKPVKMMTGKSGLSDKGKIVNVGGATHFDVWTSGSSCDVISGSREPSSLPPVESSTLNSFSMLLGIMCRTIKMKHVQDVSYSKVVQAKRYVMGGDTLNVTGKGSCYKPTSGQLLPRGAMAVENCCEGSPLVVSAPHFLNGDPWYRQQVDGVSEAKQQEHELYIDLEPHLGAPVGAQVRFQLNMMITPDPAFPPLRNLTENRTVLPIFWAQEGFDRAPPGSMFKMELALLLPDIFADGLIVLCLLIGLSLISSPLVKCVRILRSTEKQTTLPTKTVAVIQNNSGKSGFFLQSGPPMYNAIPFDEESSDSSSTKIL